MLVLPHLGIQKDYSASPKIKEKHRGFSGVARDLSSIPLCSLLIERLHAGLEMCVQCFGCVCSSASPCLAPVGGPSLSPLFAWLLLLCAGIRQAELCQDKTGFK